MECVMIVILGLVILLAAVIIGVAGVLGNGGSGHALTHGFSVFGYHVTGSTGTLFLTGIVVGAVALAGLSLLLAGAGRTSRRGRAARRGLKQSRRETAAVSQDRDDLIGQRDTARAQSASAPGNGTQGSDPQRDAGDSRWSGLRRFRRQFAGRPAVVEPSASVASEPASGEPADPPVPAGQRTNGSRP
jgi:hypothetical protein